MAEKYLQYILHNSVELENRLKLLGATGDNLKALTHSVSEHLSEEVRASIHICDIVRHRIIYEQHLPDKKEFEKFKSEMEYLLAELDRMINPAKKDSKQKIFVVILVGLLLLFLLLFVLDVGFNLPELLKKADSPTETPTKLVKP